MPTKNSSEFTANYLNTLRTYLFQAECKVKGDNSFDLPSSNYLSDDDMDPVERLLNAFLNPIVNALNATYTTLEQQKAQSKLLDGYMRLIDVSKADKRYSKFLTSRLEEKLVPARLDMTYLNTLLNCVNHAKLKIEGDNSFDIPATDPVKEDGMTPLDELNVYFNSIITALNISFPKMEQQDVQLELCRGYESLLESSKSHPYAKLLTEKLESGLKLVQPKENNIAYSSNRSITIDNKMV